MKFNTLIATGLCLFISINSWAHSNKWNLNDVSYLFSIPSLDSETPDPLLGLNSQTPRGEVLMPKAIYEKIPTILNAGKGNPSLHPLFKVVAVRIDPCPSLVEADCQPEMRMVWQAIEKDFYTKKWTARDGAMHSFYALSLPEFAQLKKELWAFKIENQDRGITTLKKPLNVHPAMADKKWGAVNNDHLKNIFLKYSGESRLKKVTFMSLLVPTRWWRFGSFVLDEKGQWAAEEIPRLGGAITEDLFNTTNGGDPADFMTTKMDGAINSLPESYPERDNLMPMINKSYRSADEKDLPVFKDKLHAVARFRNPHQTNPSNLDCVSCHFADASKLYAVTRFPELHFYKSKYSYKNPNEKIFNLENTTIAPKSTKIVRAFGYFEHLPAINQRTINDSAVSAHWLNTHK